MAHFFHHLFSEDLCRCLPSKAFARRVVESIADHLHVFVCDRPDVSLAGKPSSDPSIGVFHRALLPGRRGIAEPGLRAYLSLQMRPVDELCAAVEGDGFAGQVRQVAYRLHDLSHDRFGTFVWVLE